MPPIPRIVVSSPARGISGVKSVSFFKFLLRHWYTIIVILFLLPNWVDSVHTAKEMNFSVPVYLGLKTTQTVLNADSVVYETIKSLEKDPVAEIGMAKPTEGMYNKISYGWHIFVFSWKLFGSLFLIFLPFKVIYKIVRLKNTDQVKSNIWKTFVIGFIFIFLGNLLVIIVQQSSGNMIYTFDDSLNFFQKAWQIVIWVFPFHGMVEFGKYIVTALS